ncbi:response regulator [Arenibaculum pallidiluteum]|uniref:response regulator n=1 Tax=Arenibaculum pallidiluteum TaxID=2812559 RepID=UPI001A95E5EA|nr:response regulator [Arenibaculum pallidiluteum]
MAQSGGEREPFRALVADDEEAMRAFVARALTRAGFRVTEVPDGQRALEALGEERYDLLVTDIVMPVIDGISLALIATKDQPDLKVLLITGYAEERRRAMNLEALIHGVLEKPFSLNDLTRETLAALGRRAEG